MNDTYKKLLLGGLSVAIVAGGYFLIMKPNNDDKKAIQTETKNLKTTLADLQSKEVNRQEYLDGTAENEQLFEDRLGEFPSNLNQEYQIEFVQGVRENPDINYNVIAQGMAQPTAFYVLGGSNSEGELAAEPTTDGENTETMTDSNYECYTSTMNFTYEGDYKGIKDFVNYVASFPYRMTIDNVSVSSDDEGKYAGAMTVNIYCISGNGRDEQMDIDLNDVQLGSDNIFSRGGDSSVSKYAADNGEAIINDYDAVLILNPTTSDTSGKVLGLKAGGENLTSNKNAVEEVSVKVSKEDGKYIMTYSIGTETKTQEFDPGEDLTLLVQSCDIKDSSDANGVKLSLNNTSDKTLYVKVVDDTTAQRVKIVNRSGSIGVYK